MLIKMKNKVNMSRILKFSIILCTLTFQCVIVFADLWDNANNMIGDVKTNLITFANIAVFVGVAIGSITMKLSGGKPDKIELGKKIIWNSLGGYAVLNGLGLILNWISNYTS